MSTEFVCRSAVHSSWRITEHSGRLRGNHSFRKPFSLFRYKWRVRPSARQAPEFDAVSATSSAASSQCGFSSSPARGATVVNVTGSIRWDTHDPGVRKSALPTMSIRRIDSAHAAYCKPVEACVRQPANQRFSKFHAPIALRLDWAARKVRAGLSARKADQEER